MGLISIECEDYRFNAPTKEVIEVKLIDIIMKMKKE